MKNLLRKVYIKLKKLKRISYFFYVQRVKGFSVPDKPFFDSQETTNFFLKKLNESDLYIEFGGGGSTICAQKSGKPSITIEADNFFLEAVKGKLKSNTSNDIFNNVLIYRDIGLTIEWSAPVFQNVKLFKEYQMFPKKEIKKILKKAISDENILILIDGRFRVSSFLNAIIAIHKNKNWIILFDDYTVREQYHIVEEIIDVSFFVGRMAVFDSEKVKEINVTDAINLSKRYEKEYL